MPNKTEFIAIIVLCLIVFVGCGEKADKYELDRNSKLTQSDIKLLQKSYNDLTKEEERQVIVAESRMTAEEMEMFKDELKRQYVEKMEKHYSSRDTAETAFEESFELSLKEKRGELEIHDEKIIEYRIAEKSDVSFGDVIRLSWEVVVNEKVSTEELKKLSRDIVEQAKKEKKFNAIVIGFYDYEEYIGSGYTLGKVEYAPGGDWAEARTVKAGDYKEMNYNYDMYEKDWSLQLTQDEAKIYGDWIKLINKEKSEAEALSEIAKKNSITIEEVKEILLKQSVWANNKI